MKKIKIYAVISLFILLLALPTTLYLIVSTGFFATSELVYRKV
jgi:hypothetical protein